MMKGGQEIPTRTFLWISGVKAQPIVGIDGDKLGRGFRIVVDEFKRIPGMSAIVCRFCNRLRERFQRKREKII